MKNYLSYNLYFITLYFILFFNINTFYAQTTFTTLPVELPNEELTELRECYENIKAFSIDLSSVRQYVSNQVEEIKFIIEGNDFPTWEFDMKRSEIIVPGSKVTLETPTGQRTIDFSEDKSYTGFVNQYTEKRSWLYISDQIFRGIVNDGNQTYNIIPLKRILPNTSLPNTFVFYTKNLCDLASDVADEVIGNSEDLDCDNVNSDNACLTTIVVSNTLPILYLEVAVDVDYQFYLKYRSGSDNSPLNSIDDGVHGEIASLFSRVDDVYGFKYNMINIQIVNIHVWTIQDTYDNDANTMIDDLKGYWNENLSCIHRDAVHLLSAKNMNADGVAKRGHAGDPTMAYSASKHLTRTSDYTYKTILHELGHQFNLGELETGSCSGQCDTQINVPIMCQTGAYPEGANDKFTLRNQCNIIDFLEARQIKFEDSGNFQEVCNRCIPSITFKNDNNRPFAGCPQTDVVNFTVEVCNGCNSDSFDIIIRYSPDVFEILDRGAFNPPTMDPNSSFERIVIPNVPFGSEECSGTFRFSARVLSNTLGLTGLSARVASSNSGSTVDEGVTLIVADFTTIDGTITPAKISELPDVSEDCSERTSIFVKGILEIDVREFTFCRAKIKMDTDAQIIIKNGSTLNLDRTLVFGCGTTWKNILLEGGQSVINCDQSQIEHAETGINLTEAGGRINITRTRFKNNTVGIHLENSSFGGQGLVVQNFYGNTFESDGFYLDFDPDATPSGDTYLPKAGVFVVSDHNEFTTINLSGVVTPHTGFYNTFKNLHTGIHLSCPSQTNIIVQNCKFEDIFPGAEADDLIGAGIYMKGGNGNRSTLIQRGLGNATGGNITFDNCEYGIYALETSADIQNNFMHRVGTGVAALFNNNREIQINNNWIHARLYGISLAQNAAMLLAEIKNNTIFVGYPEGGLASISTGIYANEAPFTSGVPAAEGWTIQSNLIQVHKGIAGISYQTGGKARVLDNDIYLDVLQEFPNNIYHGIRFTEGKKNIIACNDIFGNANANNFRLATGILAQGVTGTSFNCNNIDNTNIGLNFLGSNTNSFSQGNGFNHHKTGLMVGNRFLPDVTLPIHTDKGNQWFELNATDDNPNDDSYGAVQWGNTQAVISSRFNVDEIESFDYLPSVLTINSSEQWFFDNPNTNPSYNCTLSNSCDGEGELHVINDLDHLIATDDIVTTYCQEAFNWTAKRQTYARLMDDFPLLELPFDLQNFMAAQSLTTIGQFYTIDKAIGDLFYLAENFRTQLHQNDQAIKQHLINIASLDSTMVVQPELEAILNPQKLNLIHVIDQLSSESSQIMAMLQQQKTIGAAAILLQNAAIDVQEEWEINEQLIRDIYLRTVAVDHLHFSAADKSAIRDLSDKCPQCDGYAVFLARTLQTIFDRELPYINEDACEDLISPRQVIESSELPVSTVNIYPIPAKDLLNIKLPNTVENATVVFFSAYGKQLLKQQINTDSYTLSLKDFPAGIYFIKILENNQRLITEQKVIITK